MFHLIGILLIGAFAGWAAAKLTGAGGANPLVMVAVGCFGAVIGPFVLRVLGLKTVGFPGTLIAAVVGAVLTILAIRYLGPKL